MEARDIDEVQDAYPLTPLQEGLLFHHLLDRDTGAYVLSNLLELQSRSCLDALIDAVQRVIDRHDALRIALRWEDVPQPIQVVHRRAQLYIEELADGDGSDVLTQMRERMQGGGRSWDLRKAPLVRLCVGAATAGGEWYALLQLHHVICDYGTLRNFIAEIAAGMHGEVLTDKSAWSYREHVERALECAKAQQGGAFFRAKLADVTEPSSPFGLDGAEQDCVFEERRERLDATLSLRLRSQARRVGVGVARLFHATWALVVARASARDDVVFGTVLLASWQRRAGAVRRLGISINTLPLRLRLGGKSVAELIDHTQTELSELLEYEQVPLVLAQRCSGMAPSTPLFNTLLNFRHAPSTLESAWALVDGTRLLHAPEARTNYPIALTVDDHKDEFVLIAQSDGRIDAARILAWYVAALESLSKALDEAPQTAALALDILPGDERRRISSLIGGAVESYRSDALLHELVEEQVQRSKEAIAVECGDESLTYAALNARANRLARYLRANGLRANGVVGICLDRSLEMVVAVLATLKAGGAYLPLDPNYPVDRLQYMLADATPEIVLTRESLRTLVPDSPAKIIVLDGAAAPIADFAADDLPVGELSLTSRNLLYLIYTSGSTGRPKGTAMPHRAMANLIEWHRRAFGADEGVRVLQFAALSFDVAFQEIFSTLCTGGSLVLIDDSTRKDAHALLEFLESRRIERLFVPPLMLQSLAECAAVCDLAPTALRDVVTAGEQLRISPEIAALFERLHGCSLHNHYGPTETHVVTTLTLTGRPRTWPTLPTIGRPIANTWIYVLDARGRPTPLGVAGEIFIGGGNLADGYLNRPDLTAARFVRDPFRSDGDARLYRTGDLGRWRADGTIEYLGRNDDQVKIRGFRVELGEVEARLALHEGVRDAAVVAREDGPGGKRLVAYVTARGESRPTAESLRTWIESTLPEFMVPSAFVVLQEFPVTPSGKLNRRALPAPDLSAYVSRDYEAPQGEVEAILAGIWESLLRVERVGRNDNFFELGGHSLLIVQLKERLRQAGLVAELHIVFESTSLAALASALRPRAAVSTAVPDNLIPHDCGILTPAMLPLVSLEQRHIDAIVRTVPGGASNVQDIYPLAPLQEGILFHHLMNEQGGDTYLVFIVLTVSSRRRLDELIEALQAVVDRHDILRSAVHWEELPRPVQVVYRAAALPVEEIELEANRDPLDQIKECIRPDRQRMDVRRAPLLRVQVGADARSGDWYAVLHLHHLTIDHVAIETITAEVVAHLEQHCDALPSPRPYREHVAQTLAYTRAHDVEAFFGRKLADVDEPTVPFGLTDVYGEGTQVADAYDRFDPSLARAIRAQARRLGVSPATLFHAAWGLVVARTSGRDDVVFGDVLLGRLQGSAGAQPILGIFINTLPLRLQLAGVTARELVEQTQRELIELLRHEQASLAVAQRCSGVRGAVPLFTSLLNYRHNVLDLSKAWAEADGVQMVSLQERTNYPLIVNVDDLGDGFGVMAQTDRRIDPKRVAGYLRTAVQALVHALDRAPQTPALLLPILPDHERDEILETFNATNVERSDDGLVHRRFEAQVERSPAATAVYYEGAALSYRELNAKANQLARHLCELGVSPDQPVAICAERGFEMVVGLLGILKAGGAYVPLDPSYPPERLEYMLADAAPRVLLTTQDLCARLPSTGATIVRVDADWHHISGYETTNLSTQVSSRHLAYVIYTSGSTGKPKGAMNEHRAVVNRLQWMQSQYGLGDLDRVLQKTPFSFDVSVWEFFWTLMTGARLIIARPLGHQDPDYLRRLIEETGVTTVHFVPSMLKIFVDQHRRGQCASLRHVVCSGEELPASLQREFFDKLPGVALSNLYGPTEAAVDVTYWECSAAADASRVPIGRPIANVRMYVLDERGQPAPIGVAGEIFIAGVAVGRGYWNRPGLTAERFVRDPFSGDPLARMYRTGDQGRWRPDGAIEYLGRNDHQVKLRGFRIELGEIEAILLGHAGVREASVVAREDTPGEKRLVAYVTRHDEAIDVEDLRAHLKASLPEYMIPSVFMVLERMPLSPNGKLDRRALPTPELTYGAGRELVAPADELEEVIAEILQTLLRVERIGRDENFFDLGGHSLLAMQAIARIQSELATEVSIRSLFEGPTVKELANAVKELRRSTTPHAVTASAEEAEALLRTLASMSDTAVQEMLRRADGGGSL